VAIDRAIIRQEEGVVGSKGAGELLLPLAHHSFVVVDLVALVANMRSARLSDVVPIPGLPSAFFF
jgi:hypothetical protein